MLDSIKNVAAACAIVLALFSLTACSTAENFDTKNSVDVGGNSLTTAKFAISPDYEVECIYSKGVKSIDLWCGDPYMDGKEKYKENAKFSAKSVDFYLREVKLRDGKKPCLVVDGVDSGGLACFNLPKNDETASTYNDSFE